MSKYFVYKANSNRQTRTETGRHVIDNAELKRRDMIFRYSPTYNLLLSNRMQANQPLENLTILYKV